jgi:transcription-repair coupling factor (superfamily II helicase)
MEFHGRVSDWIAEVRQARERGDTILFVADSHGRAERTIEILQEYEIVAVPVEHAEDAHAAAVLVAVGSLSRGFRLAMRASRFTRKPTSSKRNAARRSSGATLQRRFSPTCAT